MSEKDQWYSNRELFELINDLRFEMKETRNTIKQYNGLREKMNDMEDKLIKIEAITIGKNNVMEAIRNWGGWLFALLALIINYFN